jgi:hypothetical protein
MPKRKLACVGNGAIIGAAPAILERHERTAITTGWEAPFFTPRTTVVCVLPKTDGIHRSRSFLPSALQHLWLDCSSRRLQRFTYVNPSSIQAQLSA